MGDSDEKVLCGSCHYDDKISKAVKWCTECSEGYCDNCLSAHRNQKLSRGHHVISIHDYLATKGLEVNKSCPEHARDFEFFCPAHDMVVCIICIQECHSKCKDIAPIKEASKGVKDSTALSELEGDIESITGNLGEAFDQFKEQRKKLQDQEQAIKDKIKESRYQINSHFDRLEKSVLSELESNRDQIDMKICQKEKEMREKERMLQELKKKACDLKQFASESQMFISIRNMHKPFNSLKGEIKTLMNSCSISDLLLVRNTTDLDKILKCTTLGTITTKENEPRITFSDPKTEAAQVQQRRPRNIENVALHVSGYLQVDDRKETDNLRCCLILPDGNFVISNNSDHFGIWNRNGSLISYVRTSNQVFDMTVIDHERIAATFGGSALGIGTISIFDVKKQKEIAILRVQGGESGLYGISFYKGFLYVLVLEKCIFATNLDGEVVNTIPIPNYGEIHRLTVGNERIYLSNCVGYIDCIDFKGKVRWRKDDRSNIESSWTSPSLALGKHGFLFVAGYDANVLRVFSENGHLVKTVLQDLKQPNAIHVDKNGPNRILVCNRQGSFSVHEISY